MGLLQALIGRADITEDHNQLHVVQLRLESELGTHKSLPIVHYHGEEDDGIGCGRGKAGVARLQAAGFTNVELHVEPGLNHVDFSKNEMEAFGAFLTGLFPHLKA